MDEDKLKCELKRGMDLGNYLILRLNEPSTHGILMFGMATLGHSIDEGQIQNFLYFMSTILGFIGILTAEKQN